MYYGVAYIRGLAAYFSVHVTTAQLKYDHPRIQIPAFKKMFFPILSAYEIWQCAQNM